MNINIMMNILLVKIKADPRRNIREIAMSTDKKVRYLHFKIQCSIKKYDETLVKTYIWSLYCILYI